MRRETTDAGSPDAAPDAERVLHEVVSLLADLHAGTSRRVTLRSDLAVDLGLDSLAVVELYQRLEEAFDVRLPEQVLRTAATPADLLEAVRRARGTRAGPEPEPAAAPPLRPPGEPWPEDAATLNEALDWHVAAHPDLVSIRLVGGAGPPVEELTYAALAAEASTMARGLLQDGLGQGERVAIMLPTERAYFTVFMGALLAGAVPVPLYPPARPSALEDHLSRQAGLLRDAGAVSLVTVPEARAVAQLVRAQVPTLRAVRTPDAVADRGHTSERLPLPASSDVALVQYTSGSTGRPKGVVLTHAQLLANVTAMGRAVDVTTSDIFVSWLPLYHDMGLVGAWHAPLFFGLPLVVMSPLVFLARPASWLEAISTYRGTLSAAPNFAYVSCTERVSDAELAGLDLSSWRLAFNGSEPVSAAAVEGFVERFGRCGFRRQAMCPAYGLAEVGVGVAFTPLGRGPHVDTVSRPELARSGRAESVPAGDPDALSIVGCGTPLPGYAIRVVDEGGRELPDRREGSVECRGPSATDGYFANEEATRELWHHGWLDTGDLGYLADGELFLTGRVKDLVIRAGRNLHPEELEAAVGGLAGVRRGGVAAFAAADVARGTERLIVAVETDLRAPDQQEALRSAVTGTALDVVGIRPDQVVLLAPGSLLRTPSGKIRRRATGDAFAAGQLGQPPAPPLLQVARFGLSGLRPAAKRLVASVAAWSFALYVWVVVGVMGVPLWLVLQLPLPLLTRWRLTRSTLRAVFTAARVDVTVEGVPPSDATPVVIVANHPSLIDALVLVLVFRTPVAFATSTDLERQPFVGRLLDRLGCAFVARGQPDQSAGAVARLVEVVGTGHHLVVFPEGSISPAPGLRPLHLGAFAVATQVGCPVVPVGLRGSRDVLRAGTYLPRAAQVHVEVGSPIAPAGDGFRSQVELRDAARLALRELSGERERG